MHYFTGFLVAITLLASTGAARAEYAIGDVIHYESYDLLGGNVHITDMALSIVNDYGGSGAIKLNSGGGFVWAFCIDIADWLTRSGQYTFSPVTATNLSGFYSPGISKLAAIESVLQFGTDVYGTTPYSQTMGSSAQRNEAAQLAIWKIEYGAAITETPDDSGVNAIVASDLANIANWVGHGTADALQLTPGNVPNQMLITLERPSVMPEPDTAAVLGIAVLALGVSAVPKRVFRILRRR